MKPVALSIAGSDPSGGAGIQADLKTFHQFGVYGEAVITLLTVQNTTRVDRVVVMDPGLIVEQVRAVIGDIRPMAAKTGALGDTEAVKAVARIAARFDFPLVVDPVMVSKHGAPLIAAEASSALKRELIPRAFLLTPNLHEASALTGIEIADVAAMREAAVRLHAMGAKAVLVKGGHLVGGAVDVLYDGAEFYEYAAERIDTPHTHGTGCTYSAAITACLALGLALPEAVARAKRFITEAIRTNPGLGHGCGPVNHHAGSGATSKGANDLPMKNPPHPGDFIRTEIIEPAGLSITAAAVALQVSRPALSSLLNGKAGLSGDMALRIEKAFGVRMDTLMRMQSAYDISQTRKRAKQIRVRRIR